MAANIARMRGVIVEKTSCRSGGFRPVGEGWKRADSCAAIGKSVKLRVLQSRLPLFLSSSTVEHPAVNRRVPGSNPG